MTFLRLLSNDHWMAARTRRSVPSTETGLIPMAEVSGKRIFLYSFGKASLNMVDELGIVFRAVCKLDAGIDIFGVLAENNHVNIFWMNLG